MLFIHSFVVAAIASLSLAQRADFGPRVHMGPTRSGNDIVGLSTRFKPGYPPAREETFLALWPGLWNANAASYDLVQSVISSHERSYMQYFCGARPGQWCMQPYVLRSWRPVTTPRGVPIDGSDEILIEYRKDIAANGQWTQTLTNLSKNQKLAPFKAGDKAATTFETGTEMQGTQRGSADTQVYSNMTITLRTADPSFGRTFRADPRVQTRPPVTPDAGKTWVFDLITIPAMLPGTQFKPAGGRSANVNSPEGVEGQEEEEEEVEFANPPAFQRVAVEAGAM
ncbi:hypothetical protein LTS18_008949 [Coniosporium uncinatum]|uniref:Uncharacterized protein n=1 Tax=Coniosporium uncinatum TaxID=93489 RepID=A0ACC3D193_9PEZI|nr:hypothetical protein LTS18_008949 [Coniosporium uncinatum]